MAATETSAQNPQPNPWLALAQSVLTTGISAYAETQQARYQANDPTPNQRATGTQSAPVGQPAFSPLADTIAATFTNPTNLVMLGVAGVLLIVLLKR